MVELKQFGGTIPKTKFLSTIPLPRPIIVRWKHLQHNYIQQAKTQNVFALSLHSLNLTLLFWTFNSALHFLPNSLISHCVLPLIFLH